MSCGCRKNFFFLLTDSNKFVSFTLKMKLLNTEGTQLGLETMEKQRHMQKWIVLNCNVTCTDLIYAAPSSEEDPEWTKLDYM